MVFAKLHSPFWPVPTLVGKNLETSQAGTELPGPALSGMPSKGRMDKLWDVCLKGRKKKSKQDGN